MTAATPLVEPYEFSDVLGGATNDSLFWRVYGGKPASRVVAETRHLVVFVDLSPLMKGHLLVAPRVFYPSFAVAQPEVWQDWEFARSRIRAEMQHRWGSIVFLEHGSTGPTPGTPCITHAHIHVLPTSIDFCAELRGHGAAVHSASDQRSLTSDGAPPRPYFFVDSGGDRACFAWADDPVLPTQYLRRVVARHLGFSDGEWDWLAVVRRDLLRQTVQEAMSLGSCLQTSLRASHCTLPT